MRQFTVAARSVRSNSTHRRAFSVARLPPKRSPHHSHNLDLPSDGRCASAAFAEVPLEAYCFIARHTLETITLGGILTVGRAAIDGHEPMVRRGGPDFQRRRY